MNILKFDLKKFKQKELDELINNGGSIILRQGEIPYITPERISPYGEIIYPRSEIIYPSHISYRRYAGRGITSSTVLVSTNDSEDYEEDRVRRVMVDDNRIKY